MSTGGPGKPFYPFTQEQLDDLRDPQYRRIEILPDDILEEGDIMISNAKASIKLCANGDIEVNGKTIVNDMEVVDGMKKLLGMD